MITVILDSEKLQNPTELHRCLAESLHFPGSYGANLDALYDCLTDLSQDIQIRIPAFEMLKASLGVYAGRFLQVLRDAEAENPHLHVQAGTSEDIQNPE
jgi:ribonuclease inhibitor